MLVIHCIDSKTFLRYSCDSPFPIFLSCREFLQVLELHSVYRHYFGGLLPVGVPDQNHKLISPIQPKLAFHLGHCKAYVLF